MAELTPARPALPTRSGFVALAGRPNVGKSTLANAIVGAKVAIVSDKPQTTRRAIRGVATGPVWQLVLIDLPGVQRPRDVLTQRMQQRVERELADADGCLMVINAEQGLGPGDRFIAELLRRAGAGSLSLDAAVLTPRDDDAIGLAVEEGAGLLLGVVPGTDADLTDLDGATSAVKELWRRLGFDTEALPAAVVLTPSCGLAASSPVYARRALATCTELARRMGEAPE